MSTEELDPVLKKLYATDDARAWAKEFCIGASKHFGLDFDEDAKDWVAGWFANAMVTAQDIAERRRHECGSVDDSKYGKLFVHRGHGEHEPCPVKDKRK